MTKNAADKTTGRQPREAVEQALAAAASILAETAPADSSPADDPNQIRIDPAVLHQLVQNKNAKLIAMMVHETALLEAALDQERNVSADWRSKYEALKQSLQD